MAAKRAANESTSSSTTNDRTPDDEEDRMPEINGYLNPGATEDALRDAKSRLARMGELQEKLSALVGVAESEDGRVRAESDSRSGLKKLTIDPRAMRMGSDELAETITRVVSEAIADLRNRSQAMVQETLGKNAFDPKGSQARIQEAREAFDRIALDAQSEMVRLKRRLADLTPGS
jgi:DNA-binding protein YbaB